MQLTSSHPFWSVKDGLLNAYPRLDSAISCDALVVGGGISGALLATRLVSQSVDTVVVDRRDVGSGSTSASTALLQYEIDTPLHILSRKAGRKAAERAYWMGVESVERLERLSKGRCAFHRRPSLQFAQNDREVTRLRLEYKARKKAGLAVEWLDAADLKGSKIHVKAGLRSEIAAEVDPFAFTHFLLKRARRKGVRVFDRTGTAAYTPTPRGVEATTDDGLKIRAKAIFFATGYETHDILPANIVTLRSTYAIATEPLPSDRLWKDRAVLWGAGDPYLYARTTADHRIIAGGADDDVVHGKKRDAQIPRKTRLIERKLRGLMPDVESQTAFAWAGTFASTEDGLAYVGPCPQFPRAFFALGFGGNGITFAEAAARIVTDQFLQKKNRDAAIFAFER